jgi:hypothetical protein
VLKMLLACDAGYPRLDTGEHERDPTTIRRTGFREATMSRRFSCTIIVETSTFWANYKGEERHAETSNPGQAL